MALENMQNTFAIKINNVEISKKSQLRSQKKSWLPPHQQVSQCPCGGHINLGLVFTFVD